MKSGQMGAPGGCAVTEAEILEQVIAARSYLDVTISQVIGLTVAMVVGVYYFLHRSGWMVKVGVFLLYALGWFVMASSAGITSRHLLGLYSDLAALAAQGPVSAAAASVLQTMRDPLGAAYIVATNIGASLLPVGAFVFLFFWKPRPEPAPVSAAESKTPPRRVRSGVSKRVAKKPS